MNFGNKLWRKTKKVWGPPTKQGRMLTTLGLSYNYYMLADILLKRYSLILLNHRLAMAAYAALTSLKYIIDQLRDHPSPPISLNEKQAGSLTEKVTFLQEFLETYHSPVADSNEADPLEMRIADAAYAAEDVIESHIVDMIQLRRSTTTTTTTFQPKLDSGEGTSSSGGSKKQKKPIMSFNSFGFLMKPINYGKKIDSKYGLHQDMRKVIKDMDLIEQDVMKIKNEKTTIVEAHVSASGGSSSRSSIMPVGLDDVLIQIFDKLTGGLKNRQVIPIVGMGGIGKTTLALHIYGLPVIKDHFDVCAWATISQKYNSKEILSELLSQANKKSKEELSYMSEYEVGSELYQYLFSRRFLIVLDDMWSIEAWEEIQRFFPENGNSSRIVVTTRLSTLGSELDNHYCLKMKFLDEGSSWDLFSKYVFGEGSCPLELQEIGKQIVKNCGGLPLSIVVVGGLLRKMEHTRECWESIRENSSSVVNSENEDLSLKILKTSYNHLPVYLKPCFLYMGVFEEDRVIRVSTLVKLWISEGFLRPMRGKSLEMAAKDYLTDLVDRNLILVHELGCTGNIKYCKIHDLLRGLCWREAKKEGFYNVIGQHKFGGLNRQHRVVIRESTSKEEVHDALRSMLHARCVVGDSKEVVAPLPESRLLRILIAYDRDRSGGHGYELDDVFRFVNSRYLAVGVHRQSQFPSSLGLLWNLHTFVVFYPQGVVDAPNEIWKMPQLRHVEFHKGYLRRQAPILEVGSRKGSVVVMKNLQTLKGVHFWVTRVSSTIIPYIKKLEVVHGYLPVLHLLTELESYRCLGGVFVGECTFPHSLKKLSLGSNTSPWEVNEVLLEKIGALPHLQKLQFIRAQFPRCKQETVEGQLKEWATSEGQFPSLKFLELNSCLLESWTAESSHFPRLEKLRLFRMKVLEEIPSEIGDIPTLQSILLEYCSESVVVSAKNIAEEQEDLQIRVVLFNNSNNQQLRSLSSPNFLVEIVDL